MRVYVRQAYRHSTHMIINVAFSELSVFEYLKFPRIIGTNEVPTSIQFQTILTVIEPNVELENVQHFAVFMQ